MGIPASSLLQLLFESVLVCDTDGRVLHAYGEMTDCGHVLRDVRFIRIRRLIREALDGKPFETVLERADGQRSRVRGSIDVADGVRLVLAIEAPTPPFSEVRRGRLSGPEYDFIIANMRQGLWRIDPDGVVVGANRHLAAWLGATVSDLKGSYAEHWMTALGDGPTYEADFVAVDGSIKRGIVTRSEIFGQAGELLWSVEIIADVTREQAARRRLVEEVERMAMIARTDALTSLPNRHAFDERLRQLQGEGEAFGLVLVDLDDLKEINDSKGHPAGDRLLTSMGRRLRQAVRDSDLVARIGGDEFALLLPAATRASAEEVVMRIRELLREPLDEFGSVHASIGLGHTDFSPEGVFEQADRAMYADKRQRKGSE